MDIAALGTRRGVVTSFDDDRGLGFITDDDGNEVAFHCTSIADGTRTIEEDTSVSFRVMAGRMGRWEAGEITPVG